jgi:hypothetical protein
MRWILSMLVLLVAASAFSGCTGGGYDGKWCGNAKTDDFTLTVELDIHSDGTADYNIIKLRNNEKGLAEYFGTLNWTVDGDGRVILYENDISNSTKILEPAGSSLKWGTLYEGIEYVQLSRSSL